MSRFCLRLVSVICLAAYLLANTHASMAMESWLRSQAKQRAAVATVEGEAQSEPKKCKHCSQKPEQDGNKNQQSSPDSQDCPNGPCDDSDCPCCPNDSHQKGCPCPGGCALCSVAKAPCLTPSYLQFQPLNCIGECVSFESNTFPSPFRGSLDRPPRA